MVKSSLQLKSYQGQRIKRIINLSEYLERFSEAVHYERFLAQGFPIGSGEVESAITIYSSKAVEDSTLRLGIQIQLIRCSHCELFELMAGGKTSGRNNQLPTRTPFYGKALL